MLNSSFPPLPPGAKMRSTQLLRMSAALYDDAWGELYSFVAYDENANVNGVFFWKNGQNHEKKGFWGVAPP